MSSEWWNQRLFTTAVAVSLFECLLASSAVAQSSQQQPLPITTVPHVTDVYNIGVLDPIADRIRAQGQRLESFGNFLIQSAQAKLLDEEVLRSKLKTRIERIQHFYEVRRIRWEERELGRDRIVEARKAMEERRSDFLRNINITVQEAAGAKGLNDLLDRIAMRNLSEVEAATNPIELPSHAVKDLRVEQGTGPNKSKVMLAPTEDPYVFNPPRYFRQGEYQPRLEAYREQREQLLQKVKDGKEVTDSDLDETLARYEQLERVFEKEFAPGDNRFASNTDPDYVRFKEGKDFLEGQIRQIGLLSVVKGLPEPFEGKTLQQLVRYMTDHGYRFAKADPGGENSYYAIYQQLRDLYNKVSN